MNFIQAPIDERKLSGEELCAVRLPEWLIGEPASTFRGFLLSCQHAAERAQVMACTWTGLSDYRQHSYWLVRDLALQALTHHQALVMVRAEGEPDYLVRMGSDAASALDPESIATIALSRTFEASPPAVAAIITLGQRIVTRPANEPYSAPDAAWLQKPCTASATPAAGS